MDVGVKNVDASMKHGNEFNQFTLWFAANLTLADFALGFLAYSLNLSIYYAAVSMLLGTVIGSTIVGLMAYIGTKTGKTQMMISYDTFGKYSHTFSFLQGFSALGWFIVNLILGTYAFETILHVNFIFIMIIYAFIQISIAYFGYHHIHRVEMIFSVLLGIIFLYIAVKSNIFLNVSYSGKNSIPSFGIMMATSFSYTVSWAPYASDYSRYLPHKSSLKKLLIYIVLGMSLSTYLLEMLGFFIGIKTGLTNSMQAAYTISGSIGILTSILLILGGIGTNSINIYSSSLSINAIFPKKDFRTFLLISISILGIISSILFYNSFYQFFENFLYVLDYWIMPWSGIIIVDHYLIKKLNVDRKRVFKLSSISSLLGFIISIPFQNPGLYEMPASEYLGGVDISYFISFILSVSIFIIFLKFFMSSQQS
ncbi:MAG: purine-cytosine permease family protein [Thermoplasmata archaeon]